MDILKKVGFALAAPVLALVIAAVLSSLLLLATGDDIGGFWSTLLEAPQQRSTVSILNDTAVLYLSGIAAAIGFRMGLFNIGVEGQYRVGAFAAAVFAGQAWLPGPLNTIVAILLAVLAGALWAGIAAVLRVTRGVSEVISTIMLNSIAFLLVGYLLNQWGASTGVSRNTKAIPEGSWVGGFQIFGGVKAEVYGLSLLAVVVGVLYYVVINRTRFGFDLRATGASEPAAVAAGVDVKRMVVISMLLSGGVAALVGLPVLFGYAHNYGSSFQTGLGFTGIAVALLGRNSAVGIAFGALIFAFLSDRAQLLSIFADISPEMVLVTQGIIVLAVVIAYELVRRYRVRHEQASVAAVLAQARGKEVAA